MRRCLPSPSLPLQLLNETHMVKTHLAAVGRVNSRLPVCARMCTRLQVCLSVWLCPRRRGVVCKPHPGWWRTKPHLCQALELCSCAHSCPSSLCIFQWCSQGGLQKSCLWPLRTDGAVFQNCKVFRRKGLSLEIVGLPFFSFMALFF